MKKDPLYGYIKKSESIGLLCNQSGWHANSAQYSFQYFAKLGKLRRVFIPEHGLFGELQDQVKLNDTHSYTSLATATDWVSLYNSSNGTLTATAAQLEDLDTLVIDLQDTGSRYFTFTTTTWLLLQKITSLGLTIHVIVLDKINPAGRSVEGTRMDHAHASFIGLEGLPHRHGLTMGELCHYFKDLLQGKWTLTVKNIRKSDTLFIAPSPNIPSTITCQLYSGQCLWEGTNISEGRGTTLPFETIGAPFLDWIFDEPWNETGHPAYSKNCRIRPLRFIPVFHKYANEVCEGLQLLPVAKKKYHSLAHSLRLIRYVKERTEAFAWRPGTYEALNNKTAIELLVGDQLLLDYLNDRATWKEVRTKMEEEEQAWIKKASSFLLYTSPLQQLKIN